MSQPKSTTTRSDSSDRPDFEKSLEELEDLVTRLEAGDLSLEQSLEHFKRGVELTKTCQSILDQAQKTIDLLSEKDDDSPPTDVESED